MKVITEYDKAEWAANAAIWDDPPSEPPMVTLTITGNEAHLLTAPNDVQKWTFELNERTIPKRVTLPFTRRIFGRDGIEAIYQVDKNLLVVCFSAMAGVVPSRIPVERDRDTNVLIFRRADQMTQTVPR